MITVEQIIEVMSSCSKENVISEIELHPDGNEKLKWLKTFI